MHRRHRLRSPSDFRRATTSGRRLDAPVFAVYHVGSNDSVVRIGFSVGRHVGTAVVRNRIRRRLREAVRPWIDRLEPGDVVVVARPDAARASVDELGRAFATVVTGAGLVRR